MSKALNQSNLSERSATRALVALSLSFTLIAFGCTTDRTLGNGDPVTTPGLRNSPTGGTSSGSETAPTLPTSMTSSSSLGGEQALPVVTVRNGMSRADQAAAIMAQHQPRERYLGPAFPGMSGRGYYSDGVVTGQFQNPAYRTNPQLTINSSLTSGPNPAITSGAGDAGFGGDGDLFAGAIVGGTDIGTATGVSSGATVGGVTTGTTAATTAAAPVINTGSTGLSTVATSALPTGTLAATATPTTTPTAFSAIAPSPMVSTSPALAEQATARTAVVTNGDINGTLLPGTPAATATGGTTANLGNGVTATNGTTAAVTTTGATTAGTGRVTVGGARTTLRTTVPTATATPNAVRITTDSNGRRVITNVNTTARRNQ